MSGRLPADRWKAAQANTTRQPAFAELRRGKASARIKRHRFAAGDAISFGAGLGGGEACHEREFQCVQIGVANDESTFAFLCLREPNSVTGRTPNQQLVQLCRPRSRQRIRKLWLIETLLRHGSSSQRTARKLDNVLSNDCRLV